MAGHCEELSSSPENVPPAERPAPIGVWLEFDLDSDPIEGTLRQSERPPRRFTGCLGLSAALARVDRTPEPAAREKDE